MKLCARNGYPDPEPLSGYPVNVAIPLEKSGNLMWSGMWSPCMSSQPSLMWPTPLLSIT